MVFDRRLHRGLTSILRDPLEPNENKGDEPRSPL
jgi:hypothetical protein